jgi:AmpD protein
MAIDLVVIHGISLPPGQFGTGCIDDLFLNCLDWEKHEYFRNIKELKVSSHVLVERSGSITQYVPFSMRAWHAGVSRFRGRDRCNDFSVGIELEGTDQDPYTPAQYQSLGDILAALRERFPGLDASNVAGHCHVAPGRKTDPGPGFDWDRVADMLDAPPGWSPGSGEP